MKILKDLKFLLNYYDREDLQYFYEQLHSRVENSIRHETIDNERLTGYIWKLMAVCCERSIPQRRSYTRMTKKQRDEFKTLSASRINELVKTYDVTISKTEKENLLLSIFSLKLLIAISEQEELF